MNGFIMMSCVKGPYDTVGITGTVKCCECTELKEEERAKSSLMYASKAGFSTGIVTTTRVTHATPAAAYANMLHRDWESVGPSSKRGFHCVDAAAQLLTNASHVNVIMGGGAAEFYGPSDNTTFNMKGLFAPSHLAYQLENQDQPSLAEMTEAAIKVLSRNPKGFLLLVEGGRIDHGNHENRAQYALTETLELEKAVEKALSLVDQQETLLLVTADHSHAYGVVGYPTRDTSVLDVDNTAKGDDNKSYLISSYFNGPRGILDAPRSDPATEDRFASNYTAESLVRLSFSTHSAEDVPIYANGPYSELFHSSLDNTFIAHATMYSLCIGPYTNQSHCNEGNNGSQLRGLHLNNFIIYYFSVLFCTLSYISAYFVVFCSND
ncbi:alkaline phosphatase [Schistosoma bovis]|uniref:alkaline phosphatase n=1 Tax=Schistosoma bovis TaxID=6184 RepID=A0A430Q774_SCHBO|nr:alkaline phosphatase [Schistosoma bovis]